VARALLVGARVEEEACRVAPVVTPAESGAALSEAPVALPLALGLLVVATTTGEVLLALLHRSPALTRDAADPAGRLLQWHAHATLVGVADGRRRRRRVVVRLAHLLFHVAVVVDHIPVRGVLDANNLLGAFRSKPARSIIVGLVLGDALAVRIRRAVNALAPVAALAVLIPVARRLQATTSPEASSRSGTGNKERKGNLVLREEGQEEPMLEQAAEQISGMMDSFEGALSNGMSAIFGTTDAAPAKKVA